jgi:serine/threonine-protein kinase
VECESLAKPGSDSRKQCAEADRPSVPAALGEGNYAAGILIAHKYRLIRVLSQGGMGSVWVAHNELLDVQVALKLIRHDLPASGLAERLITEARLAARLEHPAVVSVHDVDNTERGDPYIVMELLRGEDLRELLERERQLEPERAVQCLLPILEGLSAAHAHGIVHRDLKPENIYFTHFEERIQPKIVDFGIAKQEKGEAQQCVSRGGAPVGSPDYMAPEQARGLDDVDHRADIWGIAVVLYECLTGRPPFADSTYQSVLRDIVDKRIVPITELGVDEPELWAILARGLAKSRDERWQSAREIGAALAQWLRMRGIDEDVCGRSLRVTWLGERESERPRDSIASASALLIPRAPPPGFTPPLPIPTPVPVTSSIGDPDEFSARPERARWKITGNLSRGLAIASAFVLLGIGATLGARVGNAAASPQSELLVWALADAVPRVRWAVRELTASSTSDLGVPDDLAALEPSIDADGAGPEIELRAVPRGNASSANTSRTTAPQPAPSPQRQRTSFSEVDLGF